MKLEISDFAVVGGGYATQAAHGFRPRRDVKALKLKLPLDWDMDPFHDRNWRFQLHAWRMLPAIWGAFLGKDNARLVRELMPWIEDWHRYHMRERREALMTWHDMATGVRAQHLALIGLVHSRGEIELSADAVGMVRELVAEHARKLRDDEFIARGNHAIFQLVGLRLLGEVFDDIPELEGEAGYATGHMERLFKTQFGPLSVHVENSPSYHHFAIQQFARIKPELFPTLKETFRTVLGAAREIEPWFAMPDGMIAAIGDSEGRAKAVLEPGARGDLEFDAPSGRRFLARDLSRAGYAMIRSAPEVEPADASMLIVKSQCISSGHAQADHLGFELFEQGMRLLVDSGKFTYNTDNWRKYFKSDRAHNVVGLAHRDFDPGSTPPGSASMNPVTVAASGVFRVEAKVVRSREFTHKRIFEYLPGKSLRIRDRVGRGVPGQAVAYFHLAPELTALIADEGGSVAVLDDSGNRRLHFEFDGARLRPRLVHGQTEPHIQGWFSPSYRVKLPATVIEFVADRGVRDWVIDIGIDRLGPHESLAPAPWPIQLPEPLSDLVRVRTAKMFVNQQGRREFRMLFEHPESSERAMHDIMSKTILAAGYRLVNSGQRQKGIGSTFEYAGGATLRLLVRSPTVHPLKDPGMGGSTYLALAEAPASTSNPSGK